MGKLIYLNNITRVDLPIDRVLESAIGQVTDGVIILGYDLEGNEYFATSYADGGDTLWLLERCRMRLLDGGYKE